MLWKDISGFEGLYKVSSSGKVVGYPRVYYCCGNTKRVLEEREIIGDKDKYGHRRITLYKNKCKKRVFVHRLVAEAFIPNPENKPEIDHINTLADDNRVENLRWVSHIENMNNPKTLENKSIAAKGNFMTGRFGALHHNSKKVKCIETGTVYDGISEAERKTGVRHISSVCCGRRKIAGGYHWQFV